MNDNGWELEKSFEVGNAIVEVNRFDSYEPRYSMRIGWKQGQRVGAWFPFDEENMETNYYDDVCEAVAQAESYIAEQIELQLKGIIDDTQKQRERAVEKRKRHEQNVERRREENRQRTARSKTNGR